MNFHTRGSADIDSLTVELDSRAQRDFFAEGLSLLLSDRGDLVTGLLDLRAYVLHPVLSSLPSLCLIYGVTPLFEIFNQSYLNQPTQKVKNICHFFQHEFRKWDIPADPTIMFCNYEVDSGLLVRIHLMPPARHGAQTDLHYDLRCTTGHKFHLPVGPGRAQRI